MRDASIEVRLLALDQAGLFRTADQLRDSALRKLHAVGQLGDRRLSAAVGCAFDHQEQEVPLRCEPVHPSDALAVVEEGSERGPEGGDVHDLLRGRQGLPRHLSSFQRARVAILSHSSARSPTPPGAIRCGPRLM
jgi:hypothetical protein